MDALRDIVRRELEGYAGQAANGHSYLTTNSDQRHFVLTSIGDVRGVRVANATIIVQVIGETVVVERDMFDPPLVEALLQAGLPRAQIVLAYAGEPVPESA
jgi:hypothetical protein